MLSLLWLPVILQLLLPIVLLMVLAAGREQSDAVWLLNAVSVGLYLSAVG